jgi:hypothetical protein
MRDGPALAVALLRSAADALLWCCEFIFEPNHLSHASHRILCSFNALQLAKVYKHRAERTRPTKEREAGGGLGTDWPAG